MNLLICLKFAGITAFVRQHDTTLDAGRYQIVHRDIKPMNVLLDHSTGLLKIGDFGSAKVISKLTKSTAYQVRVPCVRYLCQKYEPGHTRFRYVMHTAFIVMEKISQMGGVCSTNVSDPVNRLSCKSDLWSAGCVVGEMLRGNVLFPGRNGKHQLKLIFLCIGSPTEEDVRMMRVPTRIEFDGRVIVGTGLSKVCPSMDAKLIALLEKILIYRPKDRLWGPELLRDSVFDSIFRPNAKRQNGQLISNIITTEDIENIRKDKGSNSKVIVITPAIKKRLDFACDDIPHKQMKSKVASKKNSPPNKKLEVVQNKLVAMNNPVPQAVTERTQDAHA